MVEFKSVMMKQWIISMVLFMAVFVGCLTTIFNPIKQVTELPLSNTIIKQADMIAMGRNWTEYPDYFITVGITAVLALAGAFYSVYQLNKVKDEKVD